MTLLYLGMEWILNSTNFLNFELVEKSSSDEREVPN